MALPRGSHEDPLEDGEVRLPGLQVLGVQAQRGALLETPSGDLGTVAEEDGELVKGWIAIAIGVILIFTGCYFLGHWLEGMNFLADQ